MYSTTHPAPAHHVAAVTAGLPAAVAAELRILAADPGAYPITRLARVLDGGAAIPSPVAGREAAELRRLVLTPAERRVTDDGRPACAIAHIVRRTTADPAVCHALGTETVLTLTDVELACVEHARAYRASCGIEQDNAVAYPGTSICGRRVRMLDRREGVVQSAYARGGVTDEIVVALDDGHVIGDLGPNDVRVQV